MIAVRRDHRVLADLHRIGHARRHRFLTDVEVQKARYLLLPVHLSRTLLKTALQHHVAIHIEQLVIGEAEVLVADFVGLKRLVFDLRADDIRRILLAIGRRSAGFCCLPRHSPLLLRFVVIAACSASARKHSRSRRAAETTRKRQNKPKCLPTAKYRQVAKGTKQGVNYVRWIRTYSRFGGVMVVLVLLVSCRNDRQLNETKSRES